MSLAEHDAGDGEMEGADAVESQHRDDMVRHGSHPEKANEMLARS